MLKITASRLFVGAALTAMTSMASAAAVYCSAGSAPLSVNDIKIGGIAASDCYGHVQNTVISSYASGPGNGNNPTTINSFANGVSLFSLNDWNWVTRSNADGSGSSSQSLGGFSFALSGLTNTPTGSFTLTLTDLDPGTPPALPLMLDLVLTLKSSTLTDFYFFDDLVVNSSNSGVYSVSIMNSNFQAQGLSDITVMARDLRDTEVCAPTDPTCNPSRVPEPGSLALVLAALAAGSVASLRRRG